MAAEQPMGTEPVVVGIAQDEIEAEIMCAALRTEGIRCAHRVTNYSHGSGAAGASAMVFAGASAALPGEVMRGSGGTREILVAPQDAGTARELLADPSADVTPLFPQDAQDTPGSSTPE